MSDSSSPSRVALIRKDSVLKYETAIKSGNFVVVFHGTPDEVEKAKLILDQAKASETYLHVTERTVKV